MSSLLISQKRFVSLVLCTLILTVSAWVTPYFQWDLSLALFIQSLDLPVVKNVSYFLHELGQPILATLGLIILTGVFLLINLRAPAVLVAATVIPNALNQGIKSIIARPRPDESIVQVLVESGSNSFPSGHLVHFTVLLGTLVYLIMRSNASRHTKIFATVSAVAAICAISFARVYLGAHWASDVVGGVLWGVMYLSIMLFLYTKWRKSRS
jgi:undecaprenyl-diphosphatase